MTLTIKENQELCDWMLEKGLRMSEAAGLLCNLECGDTFPLALAKVFRNRSITSENYEKPVMPFNNDRFV